MAPVRSEFPCALKGNAGTRPGGRDTFLLHDKKVPKEACPAAPALRATLAAGGPPGRSLNSLRSDNATGLPPANLPRSAGQRGMKSARTSGASIHSTCSGLARILLECQPLVWLVRQYIHSATGLRLNIAADGSGEYHERNYLSNL